MCSEGVFFTGSVFELYGQRMCVCVYIYIYIYIYIYLDRTHINMVLNVYHSWVGNILSASCLGVLKMETKYPDEVMK
jgi:hypothetical protein